jgi:hypothetical protein
LRLLSSSRWLTLGSALLGVGALLAISWLIYVTQVRKDFWSWPGIVGAIGIGIGATFLMIGFFLPEDGRSPVTQTQRGGKGSTNLQAGRDIRFGNKDREI